MVHKQANNTCKDSQTISYKAWQNTHSQDTAHTPILYIISVNVPEDYSLQQYTVVDVQQDHSVRHCTQQLSVSNKLFPTTLYTVTVSVQQTTP